MYLKNVIVLFLVLFVYQQVSSQTCTTLGQNPSTAFPVCGTTDFSQSIVPYCGGKVIPGICTNDGILDLNPFWYKFTCYSAGTLGFLITPNDLDDDYDWEIFDVTNHNPNDVYKDVSMFVACNWSGRTGLTGASSAGTSLQNCAGVGFPTFSAMPSLRLGHDYLLLISHFTTFTPSQNGYKLTFGGGTASITDPILPDVVNATPSCDAGKITVKLNKKMKCSSLAADGSDFTISPSTSNVVSATGVGCNNGFDMDSVMLVLNKPLPPGNYTVVVKNGSDGNTLLDNCDEEILPGNNVPLVILPLLPTPMDSITSVACAPVSLQLVFKKNIQCNSIAVDGSDFIVTGPTTITVTTATGNCTNGTSSTIKVILSGPIESKGNYKITLAKGNDGNTIIDECGQETPAGSSLNFTTTDTVSANFNYTIFPGCKEDTINFFHDGRNGVNQWLWQLDYVGTSTQQNVISYFNNSGDKKITLSVSNGVCSDTSTKIIPLGDPFKASFEVTNLLCPEDAATFINTSTGNISGYVWDLGNGHLDYSKTPAPLHYPILSQEKIYPIRLIVKNNAGCFDTAVNNLKVLKSCYIAVPSAFTPNGDGVNDYLYPLNAYKADNLEFNVYNRLGQRVFHTTDWTIKWDGKINGEPQDTEMYVWILKYTNHDTGKKVFMKGTTVLIR
jgi:gliding motility-associated-like protein